jgi:hypothetical protein
MTREQYLEERIHDEHEYIEVEEATIEMLNETYSFKQIGGPFTNMSAGVVLKEYDYAAFREEFNNYQDQMIRDGNWIEYNQACWLPEVQKLIDYINDSIKNVDPFYVEDDQYRGWHYYDDMSISQGPFNSPEDCYNHACP